MTRMLAQRMRLRYKNIDSVSLAELRGIDKRKKVRLHIDSHKHGQTKKH